MWSHGVYTVEKRDADTFRVSRTVTVAVRPGASFLKLEVTSLSMVGGCPHDEGGNMFHESGFQGKTVLFVKGG